MAYSLYMSYFYYFYYYYYHTVVVVVHIGYKTCLNLGVYATFLSCSYFLLFLFKLLIYIYIIGIVVLLQSKFKKFYY